MKPTALTETQRALIDQLGRLAFATQDQLAYWVPVQKPQVSKTLAQLVDRQLVDAHDLVRPFVWYLTHSGARVAGVRLPAGRRHASWSVMAHQCHVNELEIALRAGEPDFRWHTRLELLRHGFNPAHGEHAGSAKVADKARLTFALVDDYYMGPERIQRSWKRQHTPNKKYWPDPTGRAWHTSANRFLVCTTDPAQAQRHRDWIEQAALPAEIVTIDPLWRAA